MLKRLFWLGTGVGFGVGSSFWLMRAWRRTVDRYRPSRVVARFEGDVRAAVAEGRVAMREREETLRSARGGVSPRPLTQAR